MESLRLNVLGRFEARVLSGEVLQLPTRKAEVLLTYLAMAPGQPHSRDRLMDLLWSDRSEDQARNSLRQTLSSLKRALEAIDPSPLQVDRTTVSVVSDSIGLDTHELEQSINGNNPSVTSEAANLYRGAFLEGIVIREPSGEEWLMSARDRYQRLAVEALERLLMCLCDAGEMDSAVDTGERLVTLDPLRESAWRLLMQVYMTRGERSQALKAYTRCTDILKSELGIDPEPVTIELQVSIRDGSFDAATTGIQPEPIGLIDPASAITTEPSVPFASNKPAIAVLPFTNMSGVSEQEYFSDGITEDIITELSRFSTLYVVARHSSFVFKGEKVDIKEVAEKLSVQYVVEGSVRKAGNRVRITAQLIDAESGNHIWAERYDRELEDIFALQDEITQTIVSVLPARIENSMRAQTLRKSTANFSAYDYYLQGRWTRENSGGNDPSSLTMLEKAIETDPTFALAHAYLAEIYGYNVFSLGIWYDDQESKARPHIEMALKYGENDPAVHAMIGEAYFCFGDFQPANTHLKLALQLNPNDVFTIEMYGMLKGYEGDAAEGLRWLEKAQQMEPLLYGFFCEAKAEILYLLRDYQSSLQSFREWHNPPPHTYAHIASCYAQLGDMDEARKATAKFKSLCAEDGDFPRYAAFHARLCKRQEDADNWMEGYRKAGLLD